MNTKGLLTVDETNFLEIKNFQIYKTGFENSVILKPKVFRDHRGTYTETYHELNVSNVLPVHFVQDDFSISRENVVRGFHGNYKVGKLVSCPHGKITNIIIDVNFKSPTYKKWGSITFSPACEEMLYIPPGFGNLIISHKDNSVYWYKQSDYYEGISSQFTLQWNDPDLKIPWNEFIDEKRVILSDRDKQGKRLYILESEYI